MSLCTDFYYTVTLKSSQTLPMMRVAKRTFTLQRLRTKQRGKLNEENWQL